MIVRVYSPKNPEKCLEHLGYLEYLAGLEGVSALLPNSVGFSEKGE